MTELQFKGKEFVYNHHLTVPHRPLVMDAAKGIGAPRLDGNLIIRGDNLHALKALLPIYAGRVDCIFIDPPYNTGNEGWAYNDNVNSPMIKEWLRENFDPSTGTQRGVAKDDGLRHDKWCAMMWPRLRLLHELLAEHGTMWVTLDHNEIHNALCVLRELFGEQSILALITTEANPRGRQSDVHVATVNDYLICVAKNSEEAELKGVSAGEEYIEEFKNLDDAGEPWRELGLRQRGADSLRTDREDMFFPIFVDPTTGRVSLQETQVFSTRVIPKKSNGIEGRWSWSPAYVEEQIDRVFGRVVKGRGGERWDIFYRDYLNRGGEQRRKKPRTIWDASICNNEAGGLLLNRIGGGVAFNYPKPLSLLSQIIDIAANPNSLILDSFAGSGTTAHAVLEANRRDGGNRRFILVEMEDYADRLTAERVRRVIRGYPFKGTLKTELHRENLTWAKLTRADRITETVEKIENLHGHEYDRITKRIDGGELIVTGERTVDEKAPGLGGEFTYCTLGDPIDMDRILTGEQLPDFSTLGAVLFHTATNQTCDPSAMDAETGYLGHAGGAKLWLIYQPDLDWLKTPQAALTLAHAQRIAASDLDARHIVFAPANHTSANLLRHHKVTNVEFAPLPYALYRIERG